MASPWYTDVGTVEAGGVNILPNLDDSNLSNGRLSEITATYTMTGNEIQNDLIYIKRVPSGALVDPAYSYFASSGIAATATVSVGDLDTVGGTVNPDLNRYSAAQDVHAASTSPVAFASGTTLQAPAEISDDWPFLVAKFVTLATPTAKGTLVFRIKLCGIL